MMTRLRIHLPRCPSRLSLRAGSVVDSAGPLTPAVLVQAEKTTLSQESFENLLALRDRADSAALEESRRASGLLEEVSAALVALHQQRQELLAELQAAAVELAVAAAAWLTGAIVRADQFAVDELVQAAVKQLQTPEAVLVRLNPADHRLLRTLLQNSTAGGLPESVTVVDDGSVTRGGCRVEAGRHLLISDLESRLEVIRRSWKDSLDAA